MLTIICNIYAKIKSERNPIFECLLLSIERRTVRMNWKRNVYKNVHKGVLVLNDFYRIGDKLVSMEKLNRSLAEMLTLRSTGLSQQEVADRCGVDRTFLSRLEKLGAVRKEKALLLSVFQYRTRKRSFPYWMSWGLSSDC